MLDARRTAVRRCVIVAAIALLGLPAGAGALPGAPGQETPGNDDQSPARNTLVDITNLSGGQVGQTLNDFHDKVADQLDELKATQAKLDAATKDLATADDAIANLQFQIEDTTTDSDNIVIDAFINPPSSSALDVLAANSTVDATVTQALLDMQADSSAKALDAPQAALRKLADAKAAQRKARAKARKAQDDANAALGDLNSSMDQEVQFVAAVQAELDANARAPKPTDPKQAAALATRQAQLAAALDAAAKDKAAEDARRAIEQANAERLAAGLMFCPVDGPVGFVDTWGAARSGGRGHQGVDMMAARGTPTVAPFSGRVVHSSNSLGGLSWHVYADNGNMYYGAHLSAYVGGDGWVQAGTVIGLVGNSGDASGGATHLHFEVHPGGGAAVDPFPYADRACPGHGRS